MIRPWLWLLLFIWTGGVCGATNGATGAQVIFREGTLPDGSALRGERDGGLGIEGVAAACATCHRRSGLGMTEGRIVIPPITGKFLFRQHTTNVEDRSGARMAERHETRLSYTEATLARAIRAGVDSSGRRLGQLMPRYKLDDRSMASLVSYLRQLGDGPMRGVTDDTLHFATIVTPDADQMATRAMLEVLDHFFTDKNSFIRGGSHPLKSLREVEYRVTRRWQLHVWELTGAPASWAGQLRAQLARQPVLAVISGLGGSTWEPIHEFCEQEALPCLFPNIDLPRIAAGDFYPVYFSRGVWLESDLLAQRLQAAHQVGAIQGVVQVYRAGEIGAAAAQALQVALAKAGLAVRMRPLGSVGSAEEGLASAVSGLDPDHDALVLWLHPRDLSLLPASGPAAKLILLSGLMGDLEHAPLPAAWHRAVGMSYPLDLPDFRQVRMNFPLGWFRIHHIVATAERVQTDTYVACSILAEALGEMLDNFVPEYLLERTEDMLSHRLTNGYYPRLTLGPGQRFASKGGYLVHFAADAGETLVADSPWVVP
jgi:hypothetical protein